MKGLLTRSLIIAMVITIAACDKASNTAQLNDGGNESLKQSIDPSKQALVKFKLTDAPNHDLKSVFVDIDHMEVLVAGASKQGRLKLAKGLGLVDLLTLQNGITMPLQDVVAPAGLKITQIRLVLKPEGHYATKADGSICALQTPSAQKSGVKIILTNKVEFEAGHEYSVVVDFDALKSVVVKGNGGCLLKPVLKLKSALKKPLVVDQPGSGETQNPQEPVTPPTGDNGQDQGEELITEPNENDQTDDGWDITPIEDGAEIPEVTEDELVQIVD